MNYFVIIKVMKKAKILLNYTYLSKEVGQKTKVKKLIVLDFIHE